MSTLKHTQYVETQVESLTEQFWNALDARDFKTAGERALQMVRYSTEMAEYFWDEIKAERKRQEIIATRRAKGYLSTGNSYASERQAEIDRYHRDEWKKAGL